MLSCLCRRKLPSLALGIFLRPLPFEGTCNASNRHRWLQSIFSEIRQHIASQAQSRACLLNHRVVAIGVLRTCTIIAHDMVEPRAVVILPDASMLIHFLCLVITLNTAHRRASSSVRSPAQMHPMHPSQPGRYP